MTTINRRAISFEIAFSVASLSFYHLWFKWQQIHRNTSEDFFGKIFKTHCWMIKCNKCMYSTYIILGPFPDDFRIELECTHGNKSLTIPAIAYFIIKQPSRSELCERQGWADTTYLYIGDVSYKTINYNWAYFQKFPTKGISWRKSQTQNHSCFPFTRAFFEYVQ